MSDNRENKHNEEPHDSEEEKYSFLQETVKDEQRSKKGIMGNLCRLAGKGLIFGLAAGLAFYALRPWAMTHLGGEKVTPWKCIYRTDQRNFSCICLFRSGDDRRRKDSCGKKLPLL